MARVFVSFAIEDENLRNLLYGQKVNPRTPIDFTDYSVKEPWSHSWKTQCRARIRQCQGMISIITRNTAAAEGQIWEMRCALEEGVPLFLIHGYSAPEKKATTIPIFLKDYPVFEWTVDNIAWFVNRIG